MFMSSIFWGNRMFKLWTAAVLGSTLILAACDTLPMGTDNPNKAPAQQAGQQMKTLNNTAWQLSQLGGKVVKATASDSNLPNISFYSDLRISGNTGCNSLLGQAKVSGNQLNFDQMGMTKMACGNDNLEIPFVAALNKTTQYQITGNQLSLQDASGRIVAVLTANGTPAE